MSRSGYSEDFGDTDYPLALWRGAVASAIRGKRGQAFLIELRDALDAMPIKELIAEELVWEGAYCAIGVVAVQRPNIDVLTIDEGDYPRISSLLGISSALVQEIEHINDARDFRYESRAQRWLRVRAWVERQIKEAPL